MSRKLESALDDCLNLLRMGASVADCLARYPEHADELWPLLSLASDVRAVPTPRPDPVAVQTNRQRMLDAAQAATARQRRRGATLFASIWKGPGGTRVRRLYRATVTLAAVIVLVTLAAGALFASATDSLPGQALYPMKQFGENARLSLTVNPAKRQELQNEYLAERLREIRQILYAGHQAVLEFRGELEEFGDDYWIIGGLTVILSRDTLVEGQVAAGALVIARVSAPGDGSLQALKLQVLTNPLLLTPVITSTPTPTVTASPSSTPTPTATTTPTPSATPTPTITTTPTPSATPTPTATTTPTPSATPTPSTTLTPTPTVTFTPSPLPTDTPTPVPTSTLAPTHTEEPTPTDRPEEDDTEEP